MLSSRLVGGPEKRPIVKRLRIYYSTTRVYSWVPYSYLPALLVLYMSSLRRTLPRWILERSRESWLLLSAAPRGNFQQSLVQEARGGTNQTALSLLRYQKEWNDMRYYGFLNYMRAQVPSLMGWPAFSTLQSSSVAPSSSPATISTQVSGGEESSPPKAQVAFMVTAKMKTQLGELQYTADDVKQLTPVEASLLIAHSVPPLERAKDLPLLVAEYERHQEEDRKEIEAVAAEAAVAEAASVESTPSPSLSETRVEERGSQPSVPTHQPPDSPTYQPSPSLTQSLFGWIASENILNKPFEEAASSHLPSSSNRDWYEVVEEYADGTSDVVALHPNEEEASVDADLRKEIVVKRASREQKDVPQIQFVIRKITR